jgi:tetratricopeptide (TPR) repeat protein
MAVRKGKCIQFGVCPRADSKEVVEVEAGQDFLCPDPCGKPLQEISDQVDGRRKVLVLGAAVFVIIAFAVGGYWFVKNHDPYPELPSDKTTSPSAKRPAESSGPVSAGPDAKNLGAPNPCGLQPVREPDVNRLLVYLKQGVNYASQSKFDMALKEFDQVRQIDPNFLAMHENIAAADIKLKRYEAADRQLHEELKLVGCLETLKDDALVPFAYIVETGRDTGNPGHSRAQAMRERLGQARAVARYNLACLQSLQGRPSEALTELREAVKSGFADVRALKRDPDLAKVRLDTGFSQILEAAASNSGGK